MDFDVPNLIASLLFSVIGLFYFKYAKRNSELKFAVVGALLMAFGYFTPNIWWTIGVGIAIGAIPFVT